MHKKGRFFGIEPNLVLALRASRRNEESPTCRFAPPSFHMRLLKANPIWADSWALRSVETISEQFSTSPKHVKSDFTYYISRPISATRRGPDPQLKPSTYNKNALSPFKYLVKTPPFEGGRWVETHGVHMVAG